MKILCSIFVLITTIGCSDYGYIQDSDTHKPIKGVLVQDIINPDNEIVTGIDGKFSFSECENLIITKEGYKTDTLKNLAVDLPENVLKDIFFICKRNEKG